MRAFLGYVNEKDSEKKIVRDVFKKGDQAFLSGTLYLDHLTKNILWLLQKNHSNFFENTELI